MPVKSRQRAWQKKMVSQGRCMICGKSQGHVSGLCALHYRKHLIRMRRMKGCEPWIPGRRGRPPVGRTSQTLARLNKQLREMGYRINANRRKK
jgi:hypothetical protein